MLQLFGYGMYLIPLKFQLIGPGKIPIGGCFRITDTAFDLPVCCEQHTLVFLVMNQRLSASLFSMSVTESCPGY
jgi:hypothetical protein